MSFEGKFSFVLLFAVIICAVSAYGTMIYFSTNLETSKMEGNAYELSRHFDSDKAGAKRFMEEQWTIQQDLIEVETKTEKVVQQSGMQRRPKIEQRIILFQGEQSAPIALDGGARLHLYRMDNQDYDVKIEIFTGSAVVELAKSGLWYGELRGTHEDKPLYHKWSFTIP